MGIYIDRIRRSPRCFAMQFVAELWSEEKTFAVLIHVNYLGLHIYTPSETPLLMCSFRYVDSLVSWLSLNDMLTVHVVHEPTKRSAKLHFLTREALQIKIEALAEVERAFVHIDWEWEHRPGVDGQHRM